MVMLNGDIVLVSVLQYVIQCTSNSAYYIGLDLD